MRTNELAVCFCCGQCQMGFFKVSVCKCLLADHSASCSHRTDYGVIIWQCGLNKECFSNNRCKYYGRENIGDFVHACKSVRKDFRRKFTQGKSSFFDKSWSILFDENINLGWHEYHSHSTLPDVISQSHMFFVYEREKKIIFFSHLLFSTFLFSENSETY